MKLPPMLSNIDTEADEVIGPLAGSRMSQMIVAMVRFRSAARTFRHLVTTWIRSGSWAFAALMIRSDAVVNAVGSSWLFNCLPTSISFVAAISIAAATSEQALGPAGQLRRVRDQPADRALPLRRRRLRPVPNDLFDGACRVDVLCEFWGHISGVTENSADDLAPGPGRRGFMVR